MGGNVIPKQCKWYNCCPLKYFYEQGKLEERWVRDYCWVGNKNCIRYQKEEAGIPHPDNMLPDGSIREDLKY